MTEQEKAAALAGAVSHTADVYTLIDGGFAIYFNKAEWSTIEAALRLLAATPAAPPVVTDEMVEVTARNAALDEAAKVADDVGEEFRTRNQTAYAEGFTDACDAIYIACRALKKEPANV